MRIGPWLLGAVVATLGACADQGTPPTGAIGNPADSADQVLVAMTTSVHDNGDRRSQVAADTAYVYQAAQKMDLRKLRVVFFDEQGRQTSVLTAKMGVYSLTNGSLDARGSVFIQATDGRKLTTEHLIYDRGMLQLRSDTAFVFDSPKGRMAGTSFTSDLEFNNISVDKPRGNQRGAGVIIPGQTR